MIKMDTKIISLIFRHTIKDNQHNDTFKSFQRLTDLTKGDRDEQTSSNFTFFPPFYNTEQKVLFSVVIMTKKKSLSSASSEIPTRINESEESMVEESDILRM